MSLLEREGKLYDKKIRALEASISRFEASILLLLIIILLY